ncbi:MAG: lipid-A-disaccharide synthase [Rhodospirillales bacterium]|nr:lipid-A-disaccharide synthase [Rhodospirillales bacterium]
MVDTVSEPEGPFVYLVAGEPSGDLLGGRLMAALSRLTAGQVRYCGVGGPEMAAEGLTSLFPMSDLSVMGIVEVLPKLPRLLARISEVVNDVKARKPDVVVTIDAPDFSFRVAKRLQGTGIPVVHLVAPTVWAWRPGRARKIARFLDHILCLFPFEPPYFEKEGLAATFVGHSVVESAAVDADGAGFRQRHHISADTPLLAVLPGSRLGEVKRHLPVFRDTVELMRREFPHLQIVSVTTGPVSELVKSAMSSWSVPTRVIDQNSEKYEAMAAADVALAASGTVALELGVVGTPAIIAYQVNPLTAWIGRRLVTAKYANLINILLDREVVPERLVDQCRADILAPELSRLLRQPDAQALQRDGYKKALSMLSAGAVAPSQKAAETILQVIKDR